MYSIIILLLLIIHSVIYTW